MFFLEWKYELKNLTRSPWLLLLFILPLLFWFAAGNGQKRAEKRQQELASVNDIVREGDSMAVLLIDSVAGGLKVNVPSWRQPHQPTVFGNNNPRVAGMPPLPLAGVAVGQSDLFTHYLQPRLYGEDFMLNYTELANPVPLLFGSFDLAFVLVFLAPLVVIAFSYNMLSGDRESGTLRLVASQPLALSHWLSQRLLVRWSLLAMILIVSFLFAILAVNMKIADDVFGLFKIVFCILLYLSFWWGLAFWINLLGKSSAYNAVTLTGIWILLVLILPSFIHQLTQTLYPVPSRAQLLNDLRIVEKETEHKADSLLQGYYRSHPELIPADSSTMKAATGWKEYFASQDLIRAEMKPMLDIYETRLTQQNNFVDRFRVLSPALLAHDVLLETSGTSGSCYNAYRSQVKEYAEQWRNYFIPMVFKGENMTPEAVRNVPHFSFDYDGAGKRVWQNYIGLFLWTMFAFASGFVIYKRYHTYRLV